MISTLCRKYNIYIHISSNDPLKILFPNKYALIQLTNAVMYDLSIHLVWGIDRIGPSAQIVLLFICCPGKWNGITLSYPQPCKKNVDLPENRSLLSRIHQIPQDIKHCPKFFTRDKQRSTDCCYSTNFKCEIICAKNQYTKMYGNKNESSIMPSVQNHQDLLIFKEAGCLYGTWLAKPC